MSNESLIIEERSRDIGDFLVGRLLPFRKKRMVGPFIFVDHMGPTEINGDGSFEIDQHPHIGLATLTYLIEGEVVHADSTGVIQHIKPGDVNFMVSGKGCTHTERTPENLKGKTYLMDGYQIWVALPKDKEDMEPEFHHLSAKDLPNWKQDHLELRLIAGDAFGRKAALASFSHMFMVEITANETTELNLTDQLKGEIGIIVHKGSVQACNTKVQAGQLMISKEKDNCSITVEKDSHLFLIGGDAFPEKRYIDWNFVSSDKEKINAAIKHWKTKDFPSVPNDNSYIPYPDKLKKNN